MRRPLRLVVLVALLAFGAARAESWEYTIAVPDGLPATFELPFSVPYTGTVILEADWTGSRLLFFGVEAPGRPSYARRSGPSPQRLELAAEDAELREKGDWKLTVKALPARGEVLGRVRVTVPDAPEVIAKREAELHPPPPPPPPPPAWTLATPAPAGSGPEIARVFAAVEAFRAAVLPPADGPADACVWQTDFLIYAVAARDRYGAGGRPLDTPTLRYFKRVAEAIRQVDALRTSTDPILAGPVPDDLKQRRAWLTARYELVRPIERSLDELTELLRGGHAPALEEETWLPRLNACLTACERYFDERVRLGGDAAARSGELAGAQWVRIRAAGAVFDSFVAFLREPGDFPR
jgi:hypothetical protein